MVYLKLGTVLFSGQRLYMYPWGGGGVGSRKPHTQSCSLLLLFIQAQREAPTLILVMYISLQLTITIHSCSSFDQLTFQQLKPTLHPLPAKAEARCWRNLLFLIRGAQDFYQWECTWGKKIYLVCNELSNTKRIINALTLKIFQQLFYLLLTSPSPCKSSGRWMWR